jgi:hypothetical protein
MMPRISHSAKQTRCGLLAVQQARWWHWHGAILLHRHDEP